MTQLLHQFHFLRPWWLLALVMLPLLALPRWRRDGGQLELSRLVDAELLPYLLRGQTPHRHLPLWLCALGWLLATLALAGPTWNRVEQPLYARRPAQVVAISLSRHMLSRDVAPSRLDRARYKAHDLLSSNHDGLNALIGYAGEAFVVAPLTSDANSLSDLLDAMAPDTMPVDGNNAAAAIALGAKLMHDAKADGGSLVLITDQSDAAADAAARKALAAGVHVSVLGVGTEQGGPVPLSDGGFLHDADGHMLLAGRNDAALAALARAGGGRYVAMSADRHDIDALHVELREALATTATGQLGDQWQDRGPWLLLPLLLIVATAFRRGWLLLLLLACLPLLPTPAVAGATWQNLWQRSDQQAAQALREGHPKQAQQIARDPAWRGVAAYRAGEYAAAAADLQHAPGGDAAYNRGNALAKAQHYQDAIKAYDEALKLDPANADAKVNRKAVEDWLRQQQKQSQQQKKPGQQKSSGQGDGKQQSAKGDQGKNGKPDSAQQKAAQNGSKPSDQQNKDHQGADQKGTDQPSQPPSQENSGQDHSGDQPKPQGAQEQAEQKAKAEQAQQALKKQMDQALAEQPDKSPEKEPSHQLGALGKDDPQSKLPADIRHALQRVQDDPGALLRRKFELEYQERHGGAPNEDGQP